MGQARKSLALLKGLISELGEAWLRHEPDLGVLYVSGSALQLLRSQIISLAYSIKDL